MDIKSVRGRNVEFEMASDLELSPTESEALNILDRECDGGSGGSWYIVRKKDNLIAHPNGPFESVVFNKTKQAWEDLDDYLDDLGVESEDQLAAD